MFKKYKRKELAELRPITHYDLKQFILKKSIIFSDNNGNPLTLSISDADLMNGSPRVGDMIARNPKNHLDQWLVSEQYFKDNFEELK